MKKIGKNAKLYLIGMIMGGMTLGLTTVIADTIINSTNVSYKTTTVKAALDDLYGLTADDVWQKIYPVGSIYISAVSTSPAVLFGGTWTEFGKGRTIVGVDTSDDAFKTVEKTDGSKTHTITVENLPAHSHSVNIDTNSTTHNHSTVNTTSTNHSHGTINTSNTGAHTHSWSTKWRYGHVSSREWPLVGTGHNGGSDGDYKPNTTSAGAHTHTVTINNSGAHTHQVTINNNTGAHTHNVNGNTGSTGSGTALNTQDPYITVYMWKRTA